MKKLLIYAVILVVILAGAYLIYPKNKLSSTLDTKWKTYENSQLGFEIQAPNDWKVESNDTDTNVKTITLNSPESFEVFKKSKEWVKSGYTKDRPADPKDNLIIGYSNDIIKFASTYSNVKLNSPSLDEFMKLNTSFINPQKISFAGETSYRVNTSGMFDEETIFLQRNNELYYIIIGSNSGMNAQLRDQILSTFKFTK